ncbi:MAG TPA: saccharopine dehydrogenase C-terminal domain-containing protein [Candidatus Krumholzibacteria bacterium]
MNITVLGCGLVGGPMVRDLVQDPSLSVVAADARRDALAALPKSPNLKTVQADLSDPARVKTLVAGSDLVLSAVPGHMGFAVLRALIEARKNVVDIAFFPEDPFQLDVLARRNGVTVIVDCGVMPGMGNILAAHAASQLDHVEEILIYVGGLPQVREWPYEYRAVFSPIDVIEEYTRPARYMESGRVVTRPALSDPEYVHFPGIGTLEAFNSDGLRTMLTTIKADHMREKTLRYPGHIEKIAVLRETGFFSKEPIEINGTRITPLEFTAKILFPKWTLGENEGDLTVMKVTVRGTRAGETVTHQFDLLDYYDREKNVISMARTTGYTATSAARMIRAGLYDVPGVSAPEFIGREPRCVEFLLKELEARGIRYAATIAERSLAV